MREKTIKGKGDQIQSIFGMNFIKHITDVPNVLFSIFLRYFKFTDLFAYLFWGYLFEVCKYLKFTCGVKSFVWEGILFLDILCRVKACLHVKYV